MAARREPPAQRAVGVDGVDAVAARVDDAVGADRRARVDVAAARLGADADALRARADLEDPARLRARGHDGVEVVVVGADVDRAVVRDGGRAEDDVARRVAPLRRAVAPDGVELPVVRAEEHRAVVGDGGRRDDGAARRDHPGDLGLASPAGCTASARGGRRPDGTSPAPARARTAAAARRAPRAPRRPAAAPARGPCAQTQLPASQTRSSLQSRSEPHPLAEVRAAPRRPTPRPGARTRTARER